MSTELKLPDLDPDDPRTVSQQIANALRAAILQGHLRAGDQLPSQNELVGRYGVARETIKGALRVLDREQLIISRQGSGSFVRSRLSTTPDVTEFLKGAYDRPHVRIDYAGWRGETLSNTFPATIGALREAGGVKTLRIRLLLTDPRVTAGLPLPIDSEVEPSRVQPALIKLTDRAIAKIGRTVKEIVTNGLAHEAEASVRVHRLGPIVKVYTINAERSLIGFYPVTEHSMNIDGQDLPLHHPSGWDATTLDVGGHPQLASFANQAQAWFESIWNTIGRDYHPHAETAVTVEESTAAQ